MTSYDVVSSAYLTAGMGGCRSSANISQKMGPLREPCGTPTSEFSTSDRSPFTITCWVQLVRNDLAMAISVELYPRSIIFLTSRSCCILSKALLKSFSRIDTHIVSCLSNASVQSSTVSTKASVVPIPSVYANWFVCSLVCSERCRHLVKTLGEDTFSYFAEVM